MNKVEKPNEVRLYYYLEDGEEYACIFLNGKVLVADAKDVNVTVFDKDMEESNFNNISVTFKANF